VLEKEIKHIWKIQQQKEAIMIFLTGCSKSLRSSEFTKMYIVRRWPYEGIQIRIFLQKRRPPNLREQEG